MHAPLVQIEDRTHYRADIDGLRAVAVLSVLAYHYGFAIPGGFTGVDVFFVISGFLITSKLADDIRAGTFSTIGFYDRRIRRILPALIVMLAVTLLAGRFLLIPGDYKDLSTSTAAAAFGVSNFFFLSHTGYFDRASDLMPLLHTWSLAVEEQFYLAWPLLLFLIAAGRSRIDVAAIAGAIVLIGFGASLIWYDADPKAAFYMTAPRAWELAIGAALVFLPKLGRVASEIAIAVGMGLIFTGFALASPATFPGVAALYPCVGAALVIWPRRQPIRASVALGWLAPIGLISYSLYLWHWPVWVYFRVYINNGQPTAREALLLAAVSVLLAAASYHIVEKPFRKASAHPARNVWAGLGASTAIFCAAMYINSADGMPQRTPEAYAMRSLDVMWDWPCKTTPTSLDPATCTFGAPWIDGTAKVALWGDSNAEHLAPLIELVARRDNIAATLRRVCAAVLSEDVIYDVPEYGPTYNPGCQHANARFVEFLQATKDIKTVVISASWESLARSLKGRGHNTGTDRFDLLERSLSDLAGKISAPGRRIVVMATIPQWRHDPGPCALRNAEMFRRPCSADDVTLKAAHYKSNNRGSLAALRQFAGRHPEVDVIFPGDTLCAQECITTLNGEFLYRDGVHFRRNLTERTNRDLAALIGIDLLFQRSGWMGATDRTHQR